MTRTTLSKRLFYWGPAVAWLGVIALLSSDFGAKTTSAGLVESLIRFFDPDIALSKPEMYYAHLLFRKACHVGEYFILAALIIRAVRSGRRDVRARDVVAPVTLAVAVAIADEVHQSMRPSRTAAEMDVFVDVLGVALACVYALGSVAHRALEERVLREDQQAAAGAFARSEPDPVP